MERKDLLEKLVTSLHLNVPERKLLGAECVSAKEVAPIVKRILETNGVFPPNARPWRPGESVFEGFFLVKQETGRARLICQRSHPLNPCALADQASWDYDDCDQAVSRFMQSEWSNGIDGIQFAFSSENQLT
jgi:hypothetical protein